MINDMVRVMFAYILDRYDDRRVLFLLIALAGVIFTFAIGVATHSGWAIAWLIFFATIALVNVISLIKDKPNKTEDDEENNWFTRLFE